MPTPLTLYPLVKVATSTLSTASAMTPTSGSFAETNSGTAVDSHAGYGEMWPLSRGTSNTWAQGGSLGSASDHGWLWDDTTLEGQQLVAGTYTFAVTMNADATPVVDLYLTVYKRSSGGVYTSIGTISLTGQTINGFSNQQFTLSGSLSSMTFATGDKLYAGLQLDITSNPGSFVGAQIYIHGNNSSGVGDSAISLITPGYQAGSTTNTRTIPSTAALLATNTRTIPSSAALLQTSTRTIPSTTALIATQQRTIPSSASLLATNTRTIPSDAALLASKSRTIPSNAALLQTSARTMPSTASLQATNHRTIPCTAALSGVAVFPPVNATFYTRSGDSAHYTRSGDNTLYSR